MKAPADEKITTLAYNGCWTQWNALDDFGQPVDFITGINSNIVKVALPNSIIDDELPTVTLKFTKEISGTDSDFENMLLDKADERNFKITLTTLIPYTSFPVHLNRYSPAGIHHHVIAMDLFVYQLHFLYQLLISYQLNLP